VAENQKRTAVFGTGASARRPAFRFTAHQMMRKAEKMRA
jgi:hypothetical protein